jgi:hypothetical protein
VNISNIFTVGHKVAKEGTKAEYHGTTETEGMAIGMRSSKKVHTCVDTSDKVVISDLDRNPNLEVGFKRFASGTHLTVCNREGEFSTRTSVPIHLDASELERAADLNDGFEVKRVTIEAKPGVGTFISLADTAGFGERPFLVTPDGKLQAFLREA